MAIHPLPGQPAPPDILIDVAWIDHLDEASQTWWRSLPEGPTGHRNCPYQSLSSFAGNRLLISPDGLIADGLSHASDVVGHSFSETTIDDQILIAFKTRNGKECGNDDTYPITL